MSSAYIVCVAIAVLGCPYGASQPLGMSGTRSGTSLSSNHQLLLPVSQPPQSPQQVSNENSTARGCSGSCLPAAAAKGLADSGIGTIYYGLPSDAQRMNNASSALPEDLPNQSHFSVQAPQFQPSQYQQLFSPYPIGQHQVQHPSIPVNQYQPRFVTQYLNEQYQPQYSNPLPIQPHGQFQVLPQYEQPQYAYSNVEKTSHGGNDGPSYPSTPSFGGNNNNGDYEKRQQAGHLCFPLCSSAAQTPAYNMQLQQASIYDNSGMAASGSNYSSSSYTTSAPFIYGASGTTRGPNREQNSRRAAVKSTNSVRIMIPGTNGVAL